MPKTLGDFHEEAMDVAELALIEKRRGNKVEAEGLFRRAFLLESQAAQMVWSQLDLEPTRSVLLQSAATLALDCGRYREAERHVNAALSGYPPEEIAEELRDLYEQINFVRHLDTRGIVLAEREFQMAISGNGISSGVAPSESFVSRVRSVETLIYRAAERKIGLPYREGGSAKGQLQQKFGMYLATPRIGSFAVTFRVGAPSDQLEFQGMEGPADPGGIIDEVFACLNLYANAQMKDLQEKIPEEPYYRNFVGLANQLLPDGNEVNFVGFTLSDRNDDEIGEEGEGKDKRPTVALSKTRKEVIAESISVQSKFSETAIVKEDPIESVIGVLLQASKLKSNVITVVTDDNLKVRITVPEGMMGDIVRPLWETKVSIVFRREKRDKRILLDIVRFDEGQLPI